jgi:NTP pyrophosphatase (non-canonical NTP hydrolase)
LNKTQQAFVGHFNQQQRVNFKISKEHGFEEEDQNFYQKIALMHCELSEVVEYERKDPEAKSDHIPEFTGVEEEFADVIIRIMNTAQFRHLRLAEAIVAKSDYNATRPFMHGKKF